MIKQKIIPNIAISFVLISALFFAGAAFGEDEAGNIEPKAPIEIQGDNVEFIRDEQKAVATGSVIIAYDDMKLTCDSATVYLDRKDGLAEGNVVFEQGATILKGDQIVYNFNTKEVQIVDAAIQMPPWYGGSPQVNRDTKDVTTLSKGHITTCEFDRPHYRLQAKKIRFYPHKKVIAYHTLLYVHNMPIMYFPFFISPVVENRPPVSVTPGTDKEWGLFLLTRWPYFVSEDFKGHIDLDYREKKDFAWGGEVQYNAHEYGHGLVDGYYMNERNLEDKHPWFSRDRGDDVEAVNERQRYKIQGRHNWHIDSYTHFVGEVHKLSDPTILKDYFYNDFVRDTQPKTFASLVRGQDNYVVSLLAEKRMNRFEDVVERLPEAKLELLSTEVKDTNFYIKTDQIVTELKSKHDVHGGAADFETLRYDSFYEVSYQKKLFKFLSVKPFVGTRQTYFGEDAKTDQGTDRLRGQFLTGIDLSTKFFRVFDTKTNFLRLNIDQLRHVVTPSIKYFYNSAPTIPAAQLLQFDSLDAIKKSNGVTLDLTNTFQRKGFGGGKAKILRNKITTTYLFNDENSFKRGKTASHFSTFKFDTEITPYPWLLIDNEAFLDPLTKDFTRVNLDVVFNKDEKWYVGLGHRYEIDSSTLANLEITYKPTKKLTFQINERYEFQTKDLEAQSYTISADLHCWLLDIIYTVDEGESILVQLRLKAFPDLFIKATTSYHQPRAGSQSI